MVISCDRNQYRGIDRVRASGAALADKGASKAVEKLCLGREAHKFIVVILVASLGLGTRIYSH